MSASPDLMKPVCIDDLEEIAKGKLDRNAYEYIRSGADREISSNENIQAFNRIHILPRILKDVSRLNLETAILGQRVKIPIGISPTAMQRMAHPDGEEATASAASRSGSLMISSTLSTTPMEVVAARCGSSPRWFQLYIYKNKEITLNLVRRAEASGFSAIVVTVNTPYFGNRRTDEKYNFKVPSHLRLENFDVADKEWSEKIKRSEDCSGLTEYAVSLFDPALSWKDIRWLKSITNLPIVLKGVLTKEDAILAVENGASAILVSNHGGRQLDGVQATINALPAIVEAVKDRCEVYLDGGVRTGTDVLKALALGAKAVFLGRPVLWGLAYDGEAGVKLVLDILKKELELAMALSGCSRLSDIRPCLVDKRRFRSRI